jgi:hypothetical protein
MSLADRVQQVDRLITQLESWHKEAEIVFANASKTFIRDNADAVRAFTECKVLLNVNRRLWFVLTGV